MKMAKAFLFNGLGTQLVGMGKIFHENNAKTKVLFEKVNKVLGTTSQTLCSTEHMSTQSRRKWHNLHVFLYLCDNSSG